MKPRLGVFDLTCLGLNCVIGTGIFLTPGDIGKALGGFGPWAFLLGGLLCLGIGLCFAEMAGMFPGSGGAYLYTRMVFGEKPAFLVGWIMWLSTLLGGASVASGFGNAVASFSPPLRYPAALGIIAILAVVNYLGVRSGALSNNLLSVAKLLPLGVFIGWGLVSLPLSAGLTPPTAEIGWLAGFLGVLYTYSGFEYVPVPGGEVRHPQRTIPIALATTLVVSALLYFVVQLLVGAAGAAGSQAALVDAARSAPWLATLIGVGMLISVASVNASIAFTSPRCLWALAEAGWMPSFLRQLHPVYASPVSALLVSWILTSILVLNASFVELLQLSVLASLLQYIAAAAALLAMRVRAPRAPREFRLPGGAFIAVVTILLCITLIAITPPQYLIPLGVAVAAGIAVAGLRILVVR